MQFGRDGEGHLGPAAGVDDASAVEARVGPQHEGTGGTRRPHPTEGLGEEARRSPTRVGIAAAQADVQDVSGPRRHGVERVVAPDVVVGEVGPALFGQAVGLMDGGVDIDGERLDARTRPAGPGPSQQGAGHHIELTGVSPAETAQEGAERRRRQHDVAEHRLGGPGPQGIGIVDRVTAGQRRVDQRHRLVADIGASGRIAEVDMLVEELSQSEVLRQCGRQHQASVGHQTLIVEGHVETVETVTKYAHRNSAFP